MVERMPPLPVIDVLVWFLKRNRDLLTKPARQNRRINQQPCLYRGGIWVGGLQSRTGGNAIWSVFSVTALFPLYLPCQHSARILKFCPGSYWLLRDFDVHLRIWIHVKLTLIAWNYKKGPPEIFLLSLVKVKLNSNIGTIKGELSRNFENNYHFTVARQTLFNKILNLENCICWTSLQFLISQRGHWPNQQISATQKLKIFKKFQSYQFLIIAMEYIVYLSFYEVHRNLVWFHQLIRLGLLCLSVICNLTIYPPVFTRSAENCRVGRVPLLRSFEIVFLPNFPDNDTVLIRIMRAL